MSELFNVTVLDKKDCELKIRLTIINPEQETLYTQRNFALQLLWRYSDANSKTKAPLFKKINREKITNKLWVFSNGFKFIQKAEILETSSYPLPAATLDLPDDEWIEFWRDRTQLPNAVMLIRVTDSKWIEHLSIGESWDTTAADFDSYT